MSTAKQFIRPLDGQQIRTESELSPWQDGATQPAIEGKYLREFDEGEAISEFYEGEWLRDGFFPSDIQNAPWRGLRPSA